MDFLGAELMRLGEGKFDFGGGGGGQLRLQLYS